MSAFEQESWISVKEFAKCHHCTPQNIYRHLKIHQAELHGHGFKGPGRQGILLDQKACEIICSVMCAKKSGYKKTSEKLWSDEAFVGYAIYAMKLAGFSMGEIQCVVSVFPTALISRLHSEAEQFRKMME